MSYDEQPDAPLHGECAAEIHRLEQQRDALAAQVDVMRAALEDCLDDSREVLGNYEQIYGERYKQHRVISQRETVAKAESAIALPNTTTILRQRDAKHGVQLLRDIAAVQEVMQGGAGLLPFEIRKLADEMERENG